MSTIVEGSVANAIPHENIITAYYTNSNMPFSWLIRCRTDFVFSHVGFILPSGKIIESSALRGGVKQDTLSNFLGRAKNFAEVEYYCKDPDAFYKFLLSQEGKKYDYEGLVGYEAKDRNFQDPSAWFCSEYGEAGFVAADTPHFSDNNISISPRDLWEKRLRTVRYG